jgi:hypothetical protein
MPVPGGRLRRGKWKAGGGSGGGGALGLISCLFIVHLREATTQLLNAGGAASAENTRRRDLDRPGYPHTRRTQTIATPTLPQPALASTHILSDHPHSATEGKVPLRRL